MSRLNTLGFETGTQEWGPTAGAGTVSSSTDVARTGTRSLKLQGSGASVAEAYSPYLSSNVADRFFPRGWVYIPTGAGPTEAHPLFGLANTSGTLLAYVRLNTNRTLTLIDAAGNAITGDSAALNFDTWHCIRLDYNCTTLASSVVSAYLDSDFPFATSGTHSSATGAARLYHGSSTGGTVYFDDVAINNDAGSVEHSLPSPRGKVAYLHVDGNSSLLGTQGTDWNTGPTGGGTAYQMLDEAFPPNDATDYISLIVASTGATNRTLDFTLQPASAAGIGVNDRIRVVHVGVRGAGATNVSTNVITRLGSQAGGTITESGAVTWASTSWFVLDDADATRIPTVSHSDPQNGGPWTASLLDTAIVGVRSSDANPDMFVTSLWLTVEYDPAVTVAKNAVPLILSNSSGLNTFSWFASVASGLFSVHTSESDIQSTFRSAGVLSHLSCYISTNATTAASILRVRKNGVNGNQVLIIPAGVTGRFDSDLNLSDTVAAGDELSYAFTIGSANNTLLTWIRTLFTADSGASVQRFNGSIVALGQAGTRHVHLHGSANTTPEAIVQHKLNKAGTWRNLVVLVSANTRTTDTVFGTRINGAAGNQTLTVGTGLTGVFEDTTNTDAVAASDLVNYEVSSAGGTGTITSPAIESEFETTGREFPMILGDAIAISGGSTRYWVLSGTDVVGSASEAFFVHPLGMEGAITHLWANVNSNTLTGTMPVVVRKNLSDTLLALSIPSGTTGDFEDTTDGVVCAPDDLLSISTNGAGTGTITFVGIGVVARNRDDIDLSSELEAFWELGEVSGTRVDSHGSNDLTDNNTVTQATGKVGNAAQFTAANSEYLSRSSLATGNKDYTFAGWAYLDAKSTFYALLSKYGGVGDREFLLFYDSTADRFTWRVFDAGGNFADAVANNFGSPATATWYFFVVWHDAAANQIGISINAGTPNVALMSAEADVNTNVFELGGQTTHLAWYWNGRLDQIAFLLRKINQREIDWLYNGGVGRTYSEVSGVGGDQTATPSSSVADWEPIVPTIIPGASTIVATAATAGWTAPTPTVVSSISIQTNTASATWEAITPAIEVGAVTIQATATEVEFSPVTPTVVAGAVSITANASESIWESITPSIITLIIIPATAALSTWEPVSPTVSMGDTVVPITSALATWEIIAPSIISPVSVQATSSLNTWEVVTPTVVSGAVVLTPNAALSNWEAITPSLIPGAISILAAASTATWESITPSVLLGGSLVTTTAAIAEWESVSPTVVPGAFTTTANATSSTWESITPDVISGAVIISPVASSATWEPIIPSVELGGSLVPITATILSWESVTPTVLAGAVTLNANASVATWESISVVVIPGVVTIQATATFGLWEPITPTVFTAEFVLATAAEGTWEAVTPSVTLGGASVSVSAALAVWITQTAIAIPGATTINAAASQISWEGITPTVVSVVTIVGTPALSNWQSISPVIVTTTQISANAAIATWEGLTAQVIIGTATITSTAVLSEWASITPSILFDDGAVATSAFATWVLATALGVAEDLTSPPFFAVYSRAVEEHSTTSRNVVENEHSAISREVRS